MPRTRLILYRQSDGSVPVLDWLVALPGKARDKCLVRMERLGELGHELRRPEADYLRNGIYELRASISGRHHRILCFFHGSAAVVISHGLVKEREVPLREIDLAVRRKAQFEKDPETHSHQEEL